MQHSYEQLHLFKNEIESCKSVDEVRGILSKVDTLKNNMGTIWFGSHLAESYLNLDLSIDSIKASGEQRIDSLSKANWSEA